MPGSSCRESHAIRSHGVLFAAAVAIVLLLAAESAAAATPPMPGGNYVGETKKGRALKVKVDSSSTEGIRRGRVVQPCSGMEARFASDDGTFVAKKVNRRGKVVFNASGEFEAVRKASGAVKRLRKAKRRPRCAPAKFKAELANSAPITEKTVRYGPFHTEPSGGHGHGGGGHNVPLNGLEKPCEDCNVVGMQTDLVHPDGTSANFDTGGMLHHVVFFNAAAPDATCNGWPQRFYASGNERGTTVLPRGYGYRVRSGDDWRLVTHIMNLGEQATNFFIEVTFYTVDGSAPIDEVKPVWLDINNCGNSQYMTPAGVHTETRDFEVTEAFAGDIISIGGHLHDHGERISVTNPTRGETICSVKADYGSDPTYEGHIEGVGGCAGRPVASIAAGETLRLLSRYDAPEPIHDVMGIMFAWIAPPA